MDRFSIGIGLFSVLQSLLLLCLYQPLPDALDKPWFDTIYNPGFAICSIGLMLLAFRAFCQRRAWPGLLAAGLAFSGLLFWIAVLASLLANRGAE